MNWQSAARFMALGIVILPVIAACSFGEFTGTGATVKRSAFTSKEYGVSASPRMTASANPRKGGGRYLVGKPYTVRGQVYTPREQPDYSDTGKASWYGSDFHGRMTANGEIFSANSITGAHPTLPIPSYVRVTNLDNGRSLMVRINDRGPYLHGRVVDLSHRAAELLGYVNAGSTNVQVDYVAPAPLEGDDTRMLLASFNAPAGMEEKGSTRFAMLEERKGPTLGNDIANVFSGLFSYADGATAETKDLAIINAHDAALAMATRPTALNDWVESVDDDARAIKLGLGVFSNPDGAHEIAVSFALLGAVDEETVTIGGKAATRLTLTHLKPGASRQDALDLARELGLTDIVLY
jgi:rare lipoprotein A